MDGVQLVCYSPDTEASYWLYTMKVKDRENFIKMMELMESRFLLYIIVVIQHSIFQKSKRSLPNMDKWYKEFVHIPCGWWVGDEERERIVETIKKGW